MPAIMLKCGSYQRTVTASCNVRGTALVGAIMLDYSTVQMASVTVPLVSLNFEKLSNIKGLFLLNLIGLHV